jgi:metal-sulfur cluster biosynthetic enzyme
MLMTEASLRDALRDCFDPSVPCNIVDLGCVEHLRFVLDPDAPGATIPGVPPKYRVTVSLVPTTQEEAAVAQLSAQIQNRLAGLEQVFHSTIDVLKLPVWTPQRITPAGRRLLGLDGNPNLVQIR